MTGCKTNYKNHLAFRLSWILNLRKEYKDYKKSTGLEVIHCHV